MLKIRNFGVLWAVLGVLFLAQSAVGQERGSAEEILQKFFADGKGGMEKIADDPGEMKRYVLTLKDVNGRDRNGKTLLHYAAIKGYADVAGILLEKGASVNITDKDRRTPLHEAMSYRRYEVARLLVKNGADMTAKDRYGKVPLFSVVYDDGTKRAVRIVDFFMENGFDVKKDVGPEFLSESIARGRKEIAFILIEKGVVLNEGSLLAAVYKGYEDIFMLLLSKGLDPTQEGLLHAACGSGNLTIVKTLVEKGGKATEKDVDLLLYHGHLKTALYLNDVLRKTKGQQVDVKARCSLKPDGGQCMALFHRGYYMEVIGKCAEFIYGGCGGVVPFVSMEACRNVCEQVPGNQGAARPPNDGRPATDSP